MKNFFFICLLFLFMSGCLVDKKENNSSNNTNFSDELTFEDNRAIIFKRTAPLPTTQVKHYLSLSLKYHKVKNLVLLGV